MRRVLKWATWTVGIFAVIGVLGALVAPPLVRSALEQQLSKALHRKVTIRTVRINPYALSVTVRGLRIAERNSSKAVLSLDRLYANASSASVFHRAPVLSAIVVDGLRIDVVRLERNRYNWSDLIDQFLNKPADPNEPPVRFSLANIVVTDAAIEIDDRPVGARHTLNDIQVAIPFLSSLPVDHEVTVQPRFSAKADGRPIELVAAVKPFKDTRDTSLAIDVHGLDLTRFIAYVPGVQPVEVRSAQLETDLTLTFTQPKKGAPRVVLSGTAGLRDVDVLELSGAPLLKLPRLTLKIRAIEPLNRRLEIASVELETPKLRVHRLAGGEIYLLRLFASSGQTQAVATADASAQTPVAYRIDEIALNAGELDWIDERGARPIDMQFRDVHVKVTGFSSAAQAEGRFAVSLTDADDSTLALDGAFGLQPVRSKGSLKIERVRLPGLWPYVESFVELDALSGEVDLSTTFDYTAAGTTPNIILEDLQIALRSLALRQRRDRRELLRIPEFSVRGATFDLARRTVTVNDLTSTRGTIGVRRDADGVLNWQKLTSATPESSAANAAANEKPWIATVRNLNVARYAVTIEDERAGRAANAHLENVALVASNLSTVKGQRANVRLSATVNKTGALDLSGPFSIDPIYARLKVDARSLPILPAQPYFQDRVGVLVSNGYLSMKGDVAFELASRGPPQGTFKGAISLTDFIGVMKDGNEDALRCKSLALTGVDASLASMKFTVAELSASDFYTRLTITPAGQFVVAGMASDKAVAPEAAESRTAEASTPPAATGATQGVSVSQSEPPKPPSDIRIGKVTIAGGSVNFSDYFIKPNYSATLTDLSGTISTLAPDTAGDLNLHGRIDHTAQLEIAGKVNPFAKDMSLDIKADVRDIELPALSTYSAKYVGYGIQQGKLTMKVAYKLDNRKLTAQNQIILNQLTFGDKVESPTATKLPVLFAVSLLKDRNGVIDINLPISGSLDDPQFSVGGIVLRLIVNLVTKIITSPFALIGSLFGSKGEELAYVEFAPGSAKLSPDGDAKLEQLGKALTDRPGLRLEVAGRVDPEADRDALLQSSIDRKVAAQKLKDMVSEGDAAGSLEQVKVGPGEYDKYLAKAYNQEKFAKPRNFIGLTKQVPSSEMKQLMLQHAQVTDEDLRQLAEQRAQSVTAYLVSHAKVSADRVFLLSPKVVSGDAKDKGKPTRVDLALK
jgi:uncharacterized protein involved in outer membrane biogenesis